VRDAAQSLVERYRSMIPEGLRYEGDEYDLVHARDDVVEMDSPEEFEEKIKQLVIGGHSDPPMQEPFRLYGTMNVVVRRFENVVVVHFPLDELRGSPSPWTETWRRRWTRSSTWASTSSRRFGRRIGRSDRPPREW
jgi:hypothetical protein